MKSQLLCNYNFHPLGAIAQVALAKTISQENKTSNYLILPLNVFSHFTTVFSIRFMVAIVLEDEDVVSFHIELTSSCVKL